MTPRAAPTRRERQHQATRAEIVETARELLRDREPLSLRSVAQRMGLTAPALYRYVASYDALLHAVADDIYAELLAGMRAAAGAAEDDPTAELILGSCAFRQWSLAHEPEFSLLFTNPRNADGARPPVGTSAADCPAQHGDEPASPFAAFFADIYRRLWQQTHFPVPDLTQLAPPARQVLGNPFGHTRIPAGMFAGVPPGVVWLFIRAWARLYGIVTLEVFGHLDPRLVSSAALFRAVLADCAADLRTSGDLDRIAGLVDAALEPATGG